MLIEKTREELGEEFTVREIEMKKDVERLIPFYDMIFEMELSHKGTSIRNLLEEMQSLAGLFTFLGLFNKKFKHMNDGYIIEHDGNIAATIMIAYSFGYWEVAMVATNPQYRRRGLARKMVHLAIDHARNLDAKLCVLEVIKDNTPAYSLYKDEGFVEFDEANKLILGVESIKKFDYVFPKQYNIREITRDKKTNQDRYELDMRSTSQSSQEFVPINRTKYFKPFLLRMVRPLAMKLTKWKIEHWLIYEEELLVGSIFIKMANNEKAIHDIIIQVNPDHEEQLLEPMIQKMLDYISNNNPHGVKISSELKTSSTFAVDMYKKYGFNFYESNHLMGLKL